MLKSALATAFVAAGLLASVGSANAAEKKYTFALVPKNTNDPFFDEAQRGCRKAEKELKGAIECLYVGPGEHGGGDEEAQIVADLVTKKVDGIAVSASNAVAMASALRGAKAAGIPVITWDSDLLPQDKSERVAYVGTNNYELGVNLAKVVMKLKPNGGTICIQSGSNAAENQNARIQGVRDTLAGIRSKEEPGERLTGQNGWTEVAGCPLYCLNDLPTCVGQLEDILHKYEKLDALVPVGGMAQFMPDAYTKVMLPYKDKIASGAVAIVVGDTLPEQMELLKKGLSSGQIGQRPFDMGYKAMYYLKDIKDGKTAPSDPSYTTLEVCTPDTADTCKKQ